MAIDLATLKARVQARVETEAAAKAATAAAKRDPRKAADAYALNTLADWRNVALVLVHEEWKCACGASASSPQGLFLFQEHARMGNSTRLAAIGNHQEDTEALPRRWMVKERVVALCHFCQTSNGFTREHKQPVAPAISLQWPVPPSPNQSGRVMQPHEENDDGNEG